MEAALQFGRHSNDDQFGGFYTLGGGYEWACRPWKPVFWVYYDWASGDSNPNDGNRGTFNQLFPQTHAFLGLTDIAGRQNIEDLNFRWIAKPHERVALVAEWHVLWLEEARDALYNNSGAASRSDPTGASGDEVGHELNFTILAHVDQHTDLSFTYAHFFAGEFIEQTGLGEDANHVLCVADLQVLEPLTRTPLKSTRVVGSRSHFGRSI